MIESFRQICLQNSPKRNDFGRCLIIAEIAQTHDGSLGQAHAFIDAAAHAGADAVKFQTHIAAAESTLDEPWRVKFSPQDKSRYDYWRRMEFSAEQWADLKRHAENHGLLFLSSPFSREAFKLLNEIGVSVWKIASGEVGNSYLLKKIIETGSPVILSSGMSDWQELDEAVAQIREKGNPLAVLQCTSAYPCPPEKIGLNVMQNLRQRYDCATGLSDHSGKIFAGLAAAALGAEVLEIHLTFSREMFGPDVPSSVTTAEFSQLTAGVREIEKMLESPIDKAEAAEELKFLRRIFTKSIYAGEFIPAGTVLDEKHLRLKKPGNGIPAGHLPNLIGQKLRRSLQADEMILLEDIEMQN